MPETNGLAPYALLRALTAALTSPRAAVLAMRRRTREGHVLHVLLVGSLAAAASGCGGAAAGSSGHEASGGATSFEKACVSDWNQADDSVQHLRRQLAISAQSPGDGVPVGAQFGVLVTRYDGKPQVDAAVGSAVEADLANVTINAGDCVIVSSAGGGSSVFARVDGRFIPTTGASPFGRFSEYASVAGYPTETTLSPNAASVNDWPWTADTGKLAWISE